MSERVPCRVSADLRRHQYEQEQAALTRREPIEFDETDDGIMHDVMGNDRLGKPAQTLLCTWLEIERAANSFGVDHAKAYAALVEPMREFRKACEAQWLAMDSSIRREKTWFPDGDL